MQLHLVRKTSGESWAIESRTDILSRGYKCAVVSLVELIGRPGEESLSGGFPLQQIRPVAQPVTFAGLGWRLEPAGARWSPLWGAPRRSGLSGAVSGSSQVSLAPKSPGHCTVVALQHIIPVLGAVSPRSFCVASPVSSPRAT